MPEVTIDGQTFDFEDKEKVLQFCLDRGMELPHFCYHPAMSVPANCRQCLVEVGMPEKNRDTGEINLDEDGNPVINWMPKLQTSCSVDLAPGMVVKSHRTSETVKRAQKDNLEFLLINHPLDCPICDQAGHCPLQNQAYKYGPEGSRFEFRKVSKPKRVELGPRVVLDGERCINCTRCTRFTDEVSESHQLTIIERGVKNYPMTPPGVTFDEPYSMNVIDICPVGALTSKDFRFRARIWEMSSTPSVVTTNAKGSNCYYWVKDNQILRITPRTNLAVNEYWLADEDRLDYRRFNENRVNGPTIGNAPAAWEDAARAAADALKAADGSRIAFIGSANATVEDNYLLTKLADAVGAETPSFIPHVEPGHGDGWLRTDDRTPNSNGCRRLGMNPVDEQVLGARISGGEIDVLYVLGEDPVAAGMCSPEDLAEVTVILHATNTDNQTIPSANVSLPLAMIPETVGTLISEEGRAQRVWPAKAIKGVNRTLSMAIGKSRADKYGTPFDKWYNEDNLIDCRPGWVSLPMVAEALDQEMSYKGPKAVMKELADTNPAFAGATYADMGELGVQLEDVGEAV